MPFGELIANHPFAEAGEDLESVHGVTFSYGHDIEMEDGRVVQFAYARIYPENLPSPNRLRSHYDSDACSGTTVTGRSVSRITACTTLPNSTLPTGDRPLTPRMIVSLSCSAANSRISLAGSPLRS